MLAPVVFISHGAGPAMFFKADARSPLKEVSQGSEAEQLFRRVGQDEVAFGLPLRPSAMVVISAHWETSGGVKILMNDNHKLLYDYYGFPQSTYEIEYPAPGPSQQFAEKVRDLVNANPDAPRAQIDNSSTRGWDHGVFIPLKLMYPKAEIPILQISLDASLDPRKHLELGRALRPLRAENVLIIGSGQATHPMSRQGTAEACDAFMARLDEALMTPAESEEQRIRAVLHATRGDDELTRAMHNPRTEHLAPLLVCAGAGSTDDTVRPLFSKHMRFFVAFDLASYLWGASVGGEEAKRGEL